MRTIDVSEITENIKEMCMEANHYLSKDMDVAMKRRQRQKNPLGEADTSSASGKSSDSGRR